MLHNRIGRLTRLVKTLADLGQRVSAKFNIHNTNGSSRSPFHALQGFGLLLALGFALAIVPGCGGGGGGEAFPPAPPAPEAFVYSTSTMSGVQGADLPANVPAVPGGASWAGGTFTVTPDLPAGIILDVHTGVIAGIPTGEAQVTTHKVTVTKGQAKATATVVIKVHRPAAIPLAYPSATLTATRGIAIPAFGPADNAWAGADFSIYPVLPEGLAFSTLNGHLSGTPLAAAATAVYTVTAMKDLEAATATLTITVQEPAPKDLTYSLTTLDATQGVAIAAFGPVGNTWDGAAFTVTPTLPGGLKLDLHNGWISGTPLAAAAKATYTVTVVKGGEKATAILTIEIKEPEKLSLSYPVTTLTATRGVAIAEIHPAGNTWNGGFFTVQPFFPVGLHLDLNSGRIYGTPLLATATASYKVKVMKGGEEAFADLTITVADAPLQELKYPSSVVNATRGIYIELRPANDDWAGALFRVEPPLPKGLAINGFSGLIFGTPEEARPKATYTVFAQKGPKEASAKLEISVADAAPKGLAYLNPAPVYTLGAPITPNTPSTHGGKAESYRVEPVLPDGLILDGVTGVLTGTPKVATTRADYRVTASNGTGSCNAILSITVVAVAAGPAVTLAPFVTTGKAHLKASIPDPGPGVTIAWRLDGGKITAGQHSHTLTFTAGAVGGLKAEVTLTGAGGTRTGSAEAKVVPAPNAEIELPAALHPKDKGAAARVVDAPGQTYQWKLEPQSSAATFTSAVDGAAVSLDTGEKEGSFTISVTVHNQAMDKDEKSKVVQVQSGIWVAKDAKGSAEANPARVTATLLIDERVLVVGGQFPLPGETPRVMTGAALFDPKVNGWTNANLAAGEAFTDHTATRLDDGTVLIVGRTDAGAKVKCYDPVKNEWADRAPLATQRIRHTATHLDGDRVLVVGGQDPATRKELNAVELYDVATNLWATVAPMHQGRFGHTATFLQHDYTVLAAGGEPDARSAEVYDAHTNTWTVTGRMKYPHSDHAAARFDNGEVLVTGGFGSTGAELYDPLAKVWERTMPMRLGRSGHTATLLANNTVLVAGGEGIVPGKCVDQSEIYDIRHKDWTDTGKLQGNRIGHAAVRLQDETVLAVFGTHATVASERYMVKDLLASPGGAPKPSGFKFKPADHYWRTLELDPAETYTFKQARKAYLALVQKYHPDKKLPGSEGKMAEINAAWELIKVYLQP